MRTKEAKHTYARINEILDVGNFKTAGQGLVVRHYFVFWTKYNQKAANLYKHHTSVGVSRTSESSILTDNSVLQCSSPCTGIERQLGYIYVQQKTPIQDDDPPKTPRSIPITNRYNIIKHRLRDTCGN